MTVRRRFIASVNCPECGAADRVRRCEEGERVWIDCLACGMERAVQEPPEQQDPTAKPVRWD